MTCRECRVFLGNPVCGACRAADRVVGILKAGRLPQSEERRVTSLLRGIAGELSDLVEGHLSSGGPGPPPGGPTKGETQARTPGAEQKSQVKTELDSKSEYSYTDGEGEEEEKVADSEVKEGSKTGESVISPEQPPLEGEGSPGVKAGDAPRSSREEEALRAAPKRQLHPDFDPNYLTKRLQLFPCGKAKARGAEDDPRYSRGSRPVSGRDRRAEDGDLQRHSARPRSPEQRRERRESPDRPPLVRRPKPPEGRRAKKKAKKKKNKGVKRRERGRDYRGGKGFRRSHPGGSH